jgi:membrane-bound serine protease (ClpP class)
MALIIAVIFSFFVSWPWNLLVVLGGILVEVAEVTWGLRLAKRWRPRTGGEAMIGETAEVVEACRPNGRVRVNGELWEARCEAGADVGETVRITALKELTLTVVPVGAGDLPAADT